MSVHSEKSTWLIFLILCLPSLVRASEETQMEQTTVNITEPKNNATKDLFASETADPKKIDIVKQIRKLNEDGSYTVGYEAGDGTFKIESRDVQGNIKGTFGYVDGDGEIKRVSYSTSNATQSPLLLQNIPSTRFNRTASSTSTTRRPQPTIIYSKTSSNPTRPTVIQAIPRRRPINSASPPTAITTTESYRVVSVNTQNASESTVDTTSKPVKQFPIFTSRVSSDTIKSALLSEAAPSITEPKIYHQNGQQRMPMEINNTASTTSPSVLRSTVIYEKSPERIKENSRILRPNTFRRQLSPTIYDNEQMFTIQQSAGDDTTDVYGGSIAVGTTRPLFTTTTGRPRLVPLHSILAARQKLADKLATSSPQVHEEQQETTLEATTNKIDDGNYVTSNPIPIIQIPIPNENLDQRVLERPFIKHIPVAQFRTREFLRDNPGAAIPIGNQRILYRYNPNIPVDENGQYVRQQIPPHLPPNIIPVANHMSAQNDNQQSDVNPEKSNIIAIPVQQVGVPGGRYQLYNPYVQQQRVENALPQRIPIPVNDYSKQITAPVSTRDLKRLLQQLLIRQNRLQALMDIQNDYNQPGPPYNGAYMQQSPLFEPEYRQKSIYGPRSAYPNQFSESRPYNGYVRQIPFNPNYPYQQMYQNQQNQFPNRNDYRSQDDGYRNEVNSFDPAVPYESQRYIPKRRFYRPRSYDARYEETNMASENAEEPIEYLPPDVRESLLLKMLMLAIHPDYSPMQLEPQPVGTTPPPEYRKKVRNVQILGEENETKEIEQKREERT